MHANPLHNVAMIAERAGRQAEGRAGLAFQIVTLTCMGLMTAAAVLQVTQPLLHDMLNGHEKPKHPHGHRGR